MPHSLFGTYPFFTWTLSHTAAVAQERGSPRISRPGCNGAFRGCRGVMQLTPLLLPSNITLLLSLLRSLSVIARRPWHSYIFAPIAFNLLSLFPTLCAGLCLDLQVHFRMHVFAIRSTPVLSLLAKKPISQVRHLPLLDQEVSCSSTNIIPEACGDIQPQALCTFENSKVRQTLAISHPGSSQVGSFVKKHQQQHSKTVRLGTTHSLPSVKYSSLHAFFPIVQPSLHPTWLSPPPLVLDCSSTTQLSSRPPVLDSSFAFRSPPLHASQF